MRTEDEIRSTMSQFVEQARDPKTNEVGCTELAELTCQELDDYDEDDNIPELYFELAVEFSDELS